MFRGFPLFVALLAGLLCALGPVGGACEAWAAEALPRELKGVSVQEHLNDAVDPHLRFVDERGRPVEIGDFWQDGKPVLLTMNYLTCENLCGVQLHALREVFGKMDDFGWKPGDKFHAVMVDINPREGAEIAGQKRKAYLEQLGWSDDADWHFLTGRKDQIDALAEAIGFEYHYDEDSGQYAHPAVVSFISPEGKVARYLYGIQYSPRDVRFALIEASAGRVGSPVDKLLLSCFKYSVANGKYSPFAFGLMRLAAAVTLVFLGVFGLAMWRWEQRFRRLRSST